MIRWRILKYIAIGAALAACAFFGSIGLFTTIFDRPLGTFVPSSADVSGWVQAIGSIAAIVAAYFYGADQARRASESALKLYRLDKARTEEGCRAIVMRLRGEVSILRRACATQDAREFRNAWNRSLSAPLDATLQAFDNMPLHEIGGWEAVLLACEIRADVVRVRDMIDAHVARWYSHEQIGDVALDEVREAVIIDAHASLRALIDTANERVGQLLTDFDHTKRA